MEADAERKKSKKEGISVSKSFAKLSPRHRSEEEKMTKSKSKKHIKTRSHKDADGDTESSNAAVSTKSKKKTPTRAHSGSGSDSDEKRSIKKSKSKSKKHVKTRVDKESSSAHLEVPERKKKKKSSESSVKVRSPRMPESTQSMESSAAQEELMRACKDGSLAGVSGALEDGAMINAKGSNSWTPLMTAAYFGHSNIVAHLISHGADTAVKDDRGQTAEVIARESGRDKVTNVLSADPLLLPQLKEWDIHSEAAWVAIVEEGWSLHDVLVRDPNELKAIVLGPLNTIHTQRLLGKIKAHKESRLPIPEAPKGAQVPRKRSGPGNAPARGAGAALLNRVGAVPASNPLPAAGPPPQIQVGQTSKSSSLPASSWLEKLNFGPSSQSAVPTQSRSESAPGGLEVYSDTLDIQGGIPVSTPPTKDTYEIHGASSSLVNLAGSLQYTKILYEELEFVGGDLIGSGHFSVVKKGRYRGGLVAIKVLKGFDATDKEKVRELETEAALMSKLGNHSHVVKFIGACTDPGKPFCLVSSYCSKGSLEDVLKSGEFMTLPEQIRIAKEVCSGIWHLHSESVIHRDIAARNVLVGEGNVMYVSDFGFSRYRPEDHVYAAEHTLGPIPHMAPESLLHKTFSPASDIFSYGVLLWEIVTRRRPWGGVDLIDILRAVTSGQRLAIPVDCPPVFKTLIEQCWQKEPSERPTCQAIMKVLQAEQDQLAVLPNETTMYGKMVPISVSDGGYSDASEIQTLISDGYDDTAV